VFVGVPRVWEKVHAAVAGALAADPEKEKSFNEAVEAALPLRRKKTMEGSLSDDEQTTLDFLDEVAFNGVRQLIGMDQCEVAITSAAPISQELLEWFVAIGVPLTEIYGLSECTGPMTGEADRPIPGSVGRAIPGCEVTLADDGEVICRGGNVFQGYLKEPEKTAETVDADGWLHTGDIGTLDADGYFRIVDRKKELIITAGGKNISPANIEAALKTIPLVGQACAIGDQRKFMSALLVLDPDVAPAWAKRNGIEETNLGSLAQHPQVQEQIERGVGEVNQQFNNTEQIKKWTILGEEWPPDSDVLTPTAKLKRRGVHAKYADEIEAMYR
jgi:long-chain acyl-CoA synthetase